MDQFKSLQNNVSSTQVGGGGNFSGKEIRNEKAEPANLKSFNWGALFIFAFWGLFNGASRFVFFMVAIWLFGILTPLNPITILLNLISIGIAIYFGFKGNRYSWKHKNWNSADDFEQTQMKWNIAGVIMFVLSFLIGFFSAALQ